MRVRENGLRCGKSSEYPLRAMGAGDDQGYGRRLYAMFGQETVNV